MTLDALSRTTETDHRLIVYHHRTGPSDNDTILGAFRERGIIHEIFEQEGEKFDWDVFQTFARSRLAPEDLYLFFIENDVIVQSAQGCWIARMVETMDADPRLAFLGAAIDKSDFIAPGQLADQLGRPLTEHERALIKADSPERKQAFKPGQLLYNGHTVPGRFFCLRIAALEAGVPTLLDSAMDRFFREQGWTTGVLRTVRHRHMSLLNYFDYPEHQLRRDQHFVHAKAKGTLHASDGRAEDG
ncbi:MAG: hypothetical protein AAFS01_00330 [Pseudomonadota bacterium]